MASSLHAASESGDVETVRARLRAGEDVNVRDKVRHNVRWCKGSVTRGCVFVFVAVGFLMCYTTRCVCVRKSFCASNGEQIWSNSSKN